MPSKLKIDAYFIALVLLAVCIPLSKYGMSVAQFALVYIWLTDGLSYSRLVDMFRFTSVKEKFTRPIGYLANTVAHNFIAKIRVFTQNKLALVIASIFLLHIIGLLHTTDFAYAWKDLRTKLPLLLLPLIFSSMPALNRRKTDILLGFYVAAVLAGTLFSLQAYIQKDFSDIRQISVFISSIRFSLSVVFSIFLLVYFLSSYQSYPLWLKILISTAIIWFVSFIILLESAIGMLSLLAVSSILMMRAAFRSSRFFIKLVLTLAFLGIPISTALYLSDIASDLMFAEPVDISKLDTHTVAGSLYIHDTVNYGIEDGHYVGLYLAEQELKAAWNRRSKFDFDGHDQAGQLIRYTLIRYLASKELRKDTEGVAELSDKDVQYIEKGIANFNYIENPGVRTRISKILQGYNKYTSLQDPNGSSIMQRFEYIRTSLFLIKNNFWTGVGTGDLPLAFKSAYEDLDSPLKEKWRWRSHNQYLSVFIAFGVFGFAWFVFTLMFPIFYQSRYTDYKYLVFISILLLSMLTEDTLETQAGLTLFAFFNSFLLIACRGQTDNPSTAN
ncbi:MAG: O-antigen ligase family protein [Bacteroidales bacterium]|nr:O-antigen ligase family protein [Bacteroidales bacterium]